MLFTGKIHRFYPQLLRFLFAPLDILWRGWWHRHQMWIANTAWRRYISVCWWHKLRYFNSYYTGN